MRVHILKSTILIWLAFPLHAETVSCKNSVVSVNTQQTEYAELTCKAAEQAEALFELCNVPSLSNPVAIDIVEELEPECAGLYHSDCDWIEVLAPPLIEAFLVSDNAFGFLSIEEFFQSIVVHELTHAALDDIPCPFEKCVVANEYVAYAMQIMSLTPDAQFAFVAQAGLDQPISLYEFHPVIFFMAPDLFSQKVWTHLSQREDRCGFIGQITSGTILLDQEEF